MSIFSMWVVGRTKFSHTSSYVLSLSFSLTSSKRLICTSKASYIILYLNLVTALPVSKFPNILNVLMLNVME